MQYEMLIFEKLNGCINLLFEQAHIPTMPIVSTFYYGSTEYTMLSIYTTKPELLPAKDCSNRIHTIVVFHLTIRVNILCYVLRCYNSSCSCLSLVRVDVFQLLYVAYLVSCHMHCECSHNVSHLIPFTKLLLAHWLLNQTSLNSWRLQRCGQWC